MGIGATVQELTSVMPRPSPVSFINNRLNRISVENRPNELEFWAKNSGGLHEQPRPL